MLRNVTLVVRYNFLRVETIVFHISTLAIAVECGYKELFCPPPLRQVVEGLLLKKFSCVYRRVCVIEMQFNLGTLTCRLHAEHRSTPGLLVGLEILVELFDSLVLTHMRNCYRRLD